MRAAAVFSALARACRVPAPSATWEIVSGPTYDNSIGELELDERTADVTIRRASPTGSGSPLESRPHPTPVERAGRLRVEETSVPLLALLLVALAVGCAVGFVTWRYPRTPASMNAAHKLGETVAAQPFLRRMMAARLDPAAVTGLALTLALALVVGGGLLLGVLAYLVRTNSHLLGIDNSVAKWGNAHASALSTHGLDAITQLGSITTVLALCLVLAVVETVRTRSIWIVPFLVAVVGGEEILTNTIKQLADRVRPAFNPAAATLGPSFPSGHSATAAAFYAGAALLLGRQHLRPTRAVLAALAAGIAVAVAASRVLLDVHWLSDVIAGLALGWAWVAVCAIAFGGRLLRFGATADAAARTAKAESLPTVETNARPTTNGDREVRDAKLGKPV